MIEVTDYWFIEVVTVTNIDFEFTVGWDFDWYFMFTMIILRLWVDGLVTDITLVQIDEIWLILDGTVL